MVPLFHHQSWCPCGVIVAVLHRPPYKSKHLCLLCHGHNEAQEMSDM